MKDSLGRIIYAGKAKSLKARVSQYFSGNQGTYKTRAMVQEIYDFDIIITKTEVEALLLERTLIKHHKPRFNVLLRDDKEYPYLRVDMTEAWPRINWVRRRRDDHATYLGPFGSASQLKILLDATYRIFPLIRCSRHEFENAKRPCNYYHMKMCLAPCTLPVDPLQYKSMMRDAIDFLSGRNKDVVKAIKEKMTRAAEDESYELAALYRDQLKAFATVTEKQSVVIDGVDDADIHGLCQAATKTAFAVLTVRDGKLVGQDSFVLNSPVQAPSEALTEFLLQYYDGRSLPGEILLPFEILDSEDSEDLRLALLTGHPEVSSLTIKAPQRGARHDLLEMAEKNATYRLDEVSREVEKSRVELQVLRDTLKLSRLPQRMECIDISNIQGTAIVASNVCFVGGRPSKEHYRHYSIKDVSGAPDDFASIREVVRRRLERGLRDHDMPDLLIIDGGKGQLSAALDALREFPNARLDLISLAKSRIDKRHGKNHPLNVKAQDRSFERVFFPDQDLPTPLNPGTPEYRLLTQIRDEAHRFAITHHRKVRSKISHGSELTDIPGIGAVLRQKLLTTFGGLDGLKKASLDDLRQIQGMRETSAVALYSYLQTESEGDSKSQGDLDNDSEMSSEEGESTSQDQEENL
jgi:excinuclease ABC subunit C